jgi:propionyl-CoA synthetase
MESKWGATYEELHASSLGEQRESFWAKQAEGIDWIKKPEKILDASNPPFYRWYPDATLNITYNCLDRHAAKYPDRACLIYEGPIAKKREVWSYQRTLEEVELFAGVLFNHGVRKGDRVIIYMPMINESICAMLACARIGAIHSVVFGGFASKELASRITDSKAKVILTASCGLEPHKNVNYRELIKGALEMINLPDLPVIYVERPQQLLENRSPTEFLYHEERAKATRQGPTEMNSTDPLYILYTSGTTGQPKGIVRDCGGTAVGLNMVEQLGFDLNAGDVMFASSDIGWVVGHNFIVYGPLIRGATTIIYEGKPTGTPDPGAFWEICEKYKVKVFYTSPTAARVLRREDPEAVYPKKYDLSSVKVCGIVGERTDVHTYDYIKALLPKDCLYNDTYWQTETGWFIAANFTAPQRFPTKGGSCTKPYPGYEIVVFNEEGAQETEPNKIGNVLAKLPCPPSFMPTLWENDAFYVEKYMKAYPGYYLTGDAGYFDEDGYLHIMARIDDVINTAGHRLSTAQIEEVLISNSHIAEAAVIGGLDELRGEVPVAFVVVKSGIEYDENELKKALNLTVRTDIGPVSNLGMIFVVNKLPKTRSGKILRGTLKKMYDGKEYGVPATIEDPSVLPEIHEQILKSGIAAKRTIKFDEGKPNSQKTIAEDE